jgi:hypothetical protein
VVRLGGAPEGTQICIDGRPWRALPRGPSWLLKDVPVGKRKVELLHPQRGAAGLTVAIAAGDKPAPLMVAAEDWNPPRYAVTIKVKAGGSVSVAEYRKKSARRDSPWVKLERGLTQSSKPGGTFQFEGVADLEYRLQLEEDNSIVLSLELSNSDPDTGDLKVEYGTGAQTARLCRRNKPAAGCGSLPPLECGVLN